MASDTFTMHSKHDVIGLGAFVDPSHLFAHPGDLIEIDHTLYSHWAVYDDHSYVITLTGQDGEDIPSEEWAVVKRLHLDELSGSAVRVNNREVKAKERGLTPQPVDKTLRAAKGLMGRRVRFNLLTMNSEHYATEWKYGLGWSDQASLAIGVMKRLSPRHAHRELHDTLTSVLNSPRAAQRAAGQKRPIAS